MCGLVSHVFPILSAAKSRSSDCTQILVSKCLSPIKVLGLLGDVVDSRAETWKPRMSLEPLMVPESQDKLQKEKEKRWLIERTGANSKKLLMDKARTI